MSVRPPGAGRADRLRVRPLLRTPDVVLLARGTRGAQLHLSLRHEGAGQPPPRPAFPARLCEREGPDRPFRLLGRGGHGGVPPGAAADRKSVVSGKSVSVSVDLGGRRIITKTTNSHIISERE